MGRLRVLSLIMAVLFVLACAPQPAPTPATPIAAPKIGEKVPAPRVTTAAWEEEWVKTAEAAKREGIVSIYSSIGGGELRSALTKAIKNSFGLRLEFVAGRGAELAAKLLAERRAGLYLSDVYVAGTSTIIGDLKPGGAVAPLEPALILPEVLDLKSWYGGKLRWVDPEHSNLVFTAYAVAPVTINASMVKVEEIKSSKDLLNPKWKGRIVMNDPTVAGFGGKLAIVLGHVLGWDYMRELAKQEPVILRDERLLIEWLARGKYPVGIAMKTETVTEFQRAGAPLAYVQLEDVGWLGSGSGSIALLRNAPHPNAAKTFINWLLTKEGQTVFAKAVGAPSARLDVPTEGLDPAKVPPKLLLPNVNYFDGDTEEFLLKEPEARKMAKEVFGNLMK